MSARSRAAAQAISTHAPRTGSDRVHMAIRSQFVRISTHAPRTGSDDFSDSAATLIPYFNPRSPHGERLDYARCHPINPKISTHAPRTGSDVRRCDSRFLYLISTHAPRTGSDGARMPISSQKSSFQPTLPARGATLHKYPFTRRSLFQPTLPARGATVALPNPFSLSRLFQPTLPARGATRRKRYPTQEQEFQPTLPARGATGCTAKLLSSC